MSRTLIICLMLASTTVVQQLTPQRVERVTEYRWCVIADGARLERAVRHLVDGRPAGAEATPETILQVQEPQPASMSSGSY